MDYSRPCRRRHGCCLNTLHERMYGDSDNDLVQWINGAIETNFATLKDVNGGGAAAQIIDMLYPFSFTRTEWKRINWLPTASFQIINNFAVLQKVLDRLKIKKNINLKPLGWQRMMETRVFYQWLKKFYISRHPHYHHERTCRRNPLSRYNVHERRKQCKNGPDFENLIRSNRKKNATTSMPTVQVDHTTYSQIDRRSNVVWNPIKKKRKRGREVLRELDGLENMSLETPPKRLRKRRFYGDEKSTQLMQTPLSRFISQCSEKARRKEGRCSTNQLSQ